MSPQNKPSIVFCHGLWADGSCFSKLIPALRADGHEVITAEYGLDSAQGDVDCVTARARAGLQPRDPRRTLVRRQRHHRRRNR